MSQPIRDSGGLFFRCAKRSDAGGRGQAGPVPRWRAPCRHVSPFSVRSRPICRRRGSGPRAYFDRLGRGRTWHAFATSFAVESLLRCSSPSLAYFYCGHAPERRGVRIGTPFLPSLAGNGPQEWQPDSRMGDALCEAVAPGAAETAIADGKRGERHARVRPRLYARAKITKPLAGIVIPADAARPCIGGPKTSIPPPFPARIGFTQLS